LTQETLAEFGVLSSSYRGVIITYDDDDDEIGSGVDKKIGWTSDGKLNEVIIYKSSGVEYIRYNWIYDGKGNTLAQIQIVGKDSDQTKFKNVYDGDVLIRSEESVSSWISFDYDDGRLEKMTSYHFFEGCGWMNLLSPDDFRRTYECGVTETIYSYDSSDLLVQVQSVMTDSTKGRGLRQDTLYTTKYSYENSKLTQVVQTTAAKSTTKQFSRKGRIKTKTVVYGSSMSPTTYKYKYKKLRILEMHYSDGEHYSTETWTLIDKAN
jgi:hypothetical protein